MADSRPVARKRDAAGLAIGVVIASLYTIDALRHGWIFWPHLVVLLALAGTPLVGVLYGVPLAAFERQASLEYYTRHAGLSEEQAAQRVALASRLGRNAIATIVAGIEACFAFDLFVRSGPPPAAFLWFFAIAGAVLLGITIFGVIYALRGIRT